MPRTKGSKNRPAASLDDRITAVAAEINALQLQTKSKREELKQLKTQKEEENKNRIMAAVTASHKSADEIIAIIEAAGTPSGCGSAAM